MATNLSTNTNPNGQNFGEGITGDSGGAWVDLTADLSAYSGQTVTIGFRYWTDVAVANPGFFVDDIAISGQPLDDAERLCGVFHHRHPVVGAEGEDGVVEAAVEPDPAAQGDQTEHRQQGDAERDGDHAAGRAVARCDARPAGE